MGACNFTLLGSMNGGLVACSPQFIMLLVYPAALDNDRKQCLHNSAIETVVEMVIICVVNMDWTKCHPRNGPKVGKEEVLFPRPAMPSTTFIFPHVRGGMAVSMACCHCLIPLDVRNATTLDHSPDRSPP